MARPSGCYGRLPPRHFDFHLDQQRVDPQQRKRLQFSQYDTTFRVLLSVTQLANVSRLSYPTHSARRRPARFGDFSHKLTSTEGV